MWWSWVIVQTPMRWWSWNCKNEKCPFSGLIRRENGRCEDGDVRFIFGERIACNAEHLGV